MHGMRGVCAGKDNSHNSQCLVIDRLALSWLLNILHGHEQHVLCQHFKNFDHFFDRGFKDRHFDVIFDHLRDTLKQMEIADELSEAVLLASNTLRKSLFLR